MKKYLWIVLFLILQDSLFAHHFRQRRGEHHEQGYDISGRILDASGDALPMSPVVIRNLNIFTVTDMDGRFTFYDIPCGDHVFVVHHLGFHPFEKEVTITEPVDNLILQLEAQSLTLGSVEVTAQRGTNTGTSSFIGAQAIEHVQAVSIRDIMQLVPGAVTQNTDMTQRNFINIRSIATADEMNAMGTAIVMDGATISNAANMQEFRHGQTVTNMGTQVSTAHTGLDVREISVDNIESIEIVRGIPSVEHGNATAGAVLIRSRAGVAPLNVRFTTNPHLTQLSAGQGIRLRGNAGILNVNADYAHSIRSLKSPTEAFNRFNVATTYSNTFRNLTFNARLSADHNRASNENDRDNNFGELERLTNQGLRLNVHGTWTVPNRTNTTLEYVLAGSIREQNDFFRRRSSGAFAPITTSTETGMSEGFFIPPVYMSELTINGLPMNFQARVIGRNFQQHGIFSRRMMAGVEFRSDGNRGQGRMFDPELPHGRTAIRDRSFQDIPFVHNLSLFTDSRLGLQMKYTSLEFLVGLRFNYILPNERFELNTTHSLNPQTSVSWTVVDRRGARTLRYLNFRGGWGILSQMPTMAFLFPEPIFLDEILFRHDATETSVWHTTRLEPRVDPNLRMPRNVKWEFGTDFQVRNVRGEITFFNEHMTNGLQFLSEYNPMGFDRWFLPNGNPISFDNSEEFRFELVNQELWQVFEDGRREMVDPQSQDTTFFGRSGARSGITTRKWGIEYSLSLGTIDALRTSITIDGAYLRINRTNDAIRQVPVSSWQNRNTLPFVISYFDGNANMNAGTVHERLNTNFRLITHIPRIGIVTTLTFQAIWMERTQFVNNRAYFFEINNGDTIRRTDVWNNTTETVYVNPIKIRDIHGNVQYFTEYHERSDWYSRLRQTSNATGHFVRQRWSPYGMINLRVTKEINRNASISFFANNLLDLEGRSRNSLTGNPMARNTTLQFGAEVRLRF